MNADGDQKPKAATPYVNLHGIVVGLDGKQHIPWDSLPPADPIGDLHKVRSGEQIVINQADDPIDVGKLREHMEGDHD